MTINKVRTLALLLMAALSLGANSVFADDADAIASMTSGQRVVVNCHGYLNNFSIQLNSVIDPKNTQNADTSLEIGLVVKKWLSKNDYNFVEDSNEVGKNISIEGLIGAGQGTYNIALPYGVASTIATQFVTGIVLHTNFVNGNVKVNCTTTLKNLKSKGVVSVDGMSMPTDVK